MRNTERVMDFFFLCLSHSFSLTLSFFHWFTQPEQSSIDQKMNQAVSAAHFTFPSYFHWLCNKMSLRRGEEVQNKTMSPPAQTNIICTVPACFFLSCNKKGSWWKAQMCLPLIQHGKNCAFSIDFDCRRLFSKCWFTIKVRILGLSKFLNLSFLSNN